MDNLNPQIEQIAVAKDTNPKRKLWFWGCGGCILLSCILIGVIAYFLFSPSDESFPLDGNVSVPATVKLGDKFEIVINLTNSTAESIFIKHVELSNFLDAPTILNGAKLLSVEPEMDFEQTYANTFQYSYFREIKPGETQTVIFYMQAESTGTYYENVGVYAKHPLLGEPAFLVAFHINAIEIEITP